MRRVHRLPVCFSRPPSRIQPRPPLFTSTGGVRSFARIGVFHFSYLYPATFDKPTSNRCFEMSSGVPWKSRRIFRPNRGIALTLVKTKTVEAPVVAAWRPAVGLAVYADFRGGLPPFSSMAALHALWVSSTSSDDPPVADPVGVRSGLDGRDPSTSGSRAAAAATRPIRTRSTEDSTASIWPTEPSPLPLIAPRWTPAVYFRLF
jgi:hypothetical protein